MSDGPWLLTDPPSPKVGDLVDLDGGESRHAAGPLRLAVGDPVVLADGLGSLFDGVMRTVSGRRCQVEIFAVRHVPKPAAQHVDVALAVLHSQAMDWAVQKSVELGVETVLPLLAQRSQLGPRDAPGSLGHWRRVARQALKQCRRPWGLEVAEPLTIGDVIAKSRARQVVVGAHGGPHLADLDGAVPDLLVVGPEGGFTGDETAEMAAAGWGQLRLGRHILRAETAAVVGAAMLVAAHDDGYAVP